MSHHVVVDVKEQKLRCNRCGATAPLYLPDSVTLFVARARAFEQMHRDCQEQDKRPSEPLRDPVFWHPPPPDARYPKTGRVWLAVASRDNWQRSVISNSAENAHKILGGKAWAVDDRPGDDTWTPDWPEGVT